MNYNEKNTADYRTTADYRNVIDLREVGTED